MVDDLLQRLLTVKSVADQTRVSIQQLSDLTPKILRGCNDLGIAHSGVLDSLRSWTTTGVVLEGLLRTLLEDREDVEVCLSWSFVARTTNILSAVQSAVASVDWTKYGLTLSLSSDPQLVPAGSSQFGLSHPAIINVVILSAGLKASLMGENYDLVLELPLTFRLTDIRTAVIDSVGNPRLLSESFWTADSASVIATEVCSSVKKSILEATKTATKASRYVYDLGEPYTSIIRSQERDNLVVTLLSITPDKFLRVSARIWKKILAYKIGDDSTSTWRLNPQTSATANPMPHLEPSPNPRLEIMPEWADLTVKLNCWRFLEELWEYMDFKANEAFWSSKDEIVESPWKGWGIGPDIFDHGKVKMLWTEIYRKYSWRCTSGAWRWYNWNLRYECDHWEPGEGRASVYICADFVVKSDGTKCNLFLSFSALGQPWREIPMGIEGRRIETDIGDPFTYVHVAF